MTTSPPTLEPSFLAIQRARLLALRMGLSNTIRRNAWELSQAQSAGQGEASETEDRAQALTLTENYQLQSSQLNQERIAIDRALAKLDEGTYGFSEVSGLPIPIERLKAYPQALTAVSEELASDDGSST